MSINAFNKYIKHMTWVYQGDTSKVNPALYTQAREIQNSGYQIKE